MTFRGFGLGVILHQWRTIAITHPMGAGRIVDVTAAGASGQGSCVPLFAGPTGATVSDLFLFGIEGEHLPGVSHSIEQAVGTAASAARTHECNRMLRADFVGRHGRVKELKTIPLGVILDEILAGIRRMIMQV